MPSISLSESLFLATQILNLNIISPLCTINILVVNVITDKGLQTYITFQLTTFVPCSLQYSKLAKASKNAMANPVSCSCMEINVFGGLRRRDERGVAKRKNSQLLPDGLSRPQRLTTRSLCLTAIITQILLHSCSL
jgi:hypothetical protein